VVNTWLPLQQQQQHQNPWVYGRTQQGTSGSSRQQQAGACSSMQQQAAAGSSRQQQAAAGSSRQKLEVESAVGSAVTHSVAHRVSYSPGLSKNACTWVPHLPCSITHHTSHITHPVPVAGWIPHLRCSITHHTHHTTHHTPSATGTLKVPHLGCSITAMALWWHHCDGTTHTTPRTTLPLQNWAMGHREPHGGPSRQMVCCAINYCSLTCGASSHRISWAPQLPEVR
jgi:hypothetical protein